MSWKEQLRILEKQKAWDAAITFMERTIEANPNDVDAYIFIIFLLMNILVEESFDISKHDHYAALLKKYFDASLPKYTHNAAYLFCIGTTIGMAEWYVS